MTEPLAPGAVIGILGGGQLGRMLSAAASRLGLRCHIYGPEAAPCAADMAHAATQGAYDDAAALAAFARAVDVVTYEFENVPAAALDAIEPHAPVRPGRRALAVSQDRLEEKAFLSEIGLEVAPFAPVDDLASLVSALDRIGTPAILKTRREGYDGKGQARIHTPEDAAAAIAAMNGAPAVLEGMIAFEREISVIAARGLDGQVSAFDPGENVHENGILRRTTLPAQADAATREAAKGIAAAILDALDYVGVIGVELFVTADGLLVNEFAPRVHNSGHWTQDGAVTCQFEQHIRAVAGWPLGDATRHSDIVMENLLGDEAVGWERRTPGPGEALHLYGKGAARPGRKMGHLNRRLGPAG